MRPRTLCLLLVLVLASGCDEWTQFHGNGANSGFRAVHTTFARASEKWNVPVGNTAFSSPVVGPDGRIYVGVSKDNGELVAVSPDGVEQWRSVISNAAIVTTPALAPDGSIFLVTGHPLSDGTAMSLLLKFGADGAMVGAVPFPDTGFTTASAKIVPTAQGYEIATYVPVHLQGEAQGSELVLFDDRLDLLDRQELPVCRGDDDSWLEDFFDGIGEFFDDLFEGLDGFDHLPIPSQIVTMYGKLDPTPAVTDIDDEGRVGIVTAGPCHVVAFAKAGSTLTEVWQHELTQNPMPLSSPALMLDGTLAISGGKADWDHGHVYDLDPLTGDRLWEVKTGSPAIATPTSNGRFVYVATLDELLVLEDGEVFASREYGKDIQTASSVALSANGGFLSAGGLFLSFSYELDDELAIEKHLGGLSSPAIGDDGTIYAIADGLLLAFGEDK